jgi:hypothetical protein
MVRLQWFFGGSLGSFLALDERWLFREDILE